MRYIYHSTAEKLVVLAMKALCKGLMAIRCAIYGSRRWSRCDRNTPEPNKII